MATLGPLYPSAAVNVSEASTLENKDAWANPTNVYSDNGTETSITAATFDSPDISQILFVSGFGFTVPAGATINGIVVEIDRRSIIAGSGEDFRVQLATAANFASLVGTNKANTTLTWPTTSTVATYGSSSDTWDAGLTPTDINASTFSVALSAAALIANADIGVDYIRVTVHYTEPATYSGSFTADANIKATLSGTFTADAYIKNTVAGSFTADANIGKTTSGSFTANAYIATVTQSNFTANAYVKKLDIPGSITADSYVKIVDVPGSFTADAHLSKTDILGQFTANAYIQGQVPAMPVWVSPPDTDTITASPVLVFTIPSGPVGNYHFHMQLDQVNTFDSGSLRNLRTHVDQTGWEYFNGSTWTAVTSAGVASTYAGNEARYTVQTPLAAGTWYRRVRAGS